VNKAYINYRIYKSEVPLSFWIASEQSKQIKRGMDPHTLGKTRAAVNLIMILHDYPKLVTKVTRRVFHSVKRMRELTIGIIDDDLRKKYLRKYFAEEVKPLVLSYKLPKKVESHLLSCIYGYVDKFSRAELGLEVVSSTEEGVEVKFVIKE
jgi:hypothetical protein